MKTAAIYARYSSEAQNEQSIEGQLRVCNEFAQRNGYVVVETYIDRAMTGKNDNRADFQRMLKDATKKQWGAVIVYKLDRFARNRYEAAINRKKLTDNGVSLVSAMENIPDTPEGRLFTAMVEGYNEYYCEDLRQKTIRGFRESWEKGNYIGGVLPFGFRAENKKVYIDEKEAEYVRLIFDLYSKGHTAEYIVGVLKELGVRRKSGTFLNKHSIFNLLGNVRYTGKVYWGEKWYDNIFPRIVDDVTWQRVQNIRELNKHAPSRRKEVRGFILTGKLVCGNCKKPMTGESGTGRNGVHSYYACLTKRRKLGTCPTHAVRKGELEDFVLDVTYSLLKNDGALQILADSIYALHLKDMEDNSILKSLQNRKAQAEKNANNLIAAIEQGIITAQTKTRLKELETEISTLENEILKEQAKKRALLTPTKILSFLKSFLKGDKDNIEVRKLIVSSLIKEIILCDDKIIISYYFQDEIDISISKPEKIAQEIGRNNHSALKNSTGSPIFEGVQPVKYREKSRYFCLLRV